VENLLDNARGHAGGSAVEVGVAVEPASDGGPRTVVSVRDHGPGVAPEDRGRIFASFASGNGGLSSGHVGLGLAICREIVAAHEGTIWVEDAPGGGSIFAFALPAIESPEGVDVEPVQVQEARAKPA
jgi:two-component system OmpR family sensor kinase